MKGSISTSSIIVEKATTVTLETKGEIYIF